MLNRVLDHNQIAFVAGLEHNPRLKELYLSYQKLPGDMTLNFSQETLQSLGVRLVGAVRRLRDFVVSSRVRSASQACLLVVVVVQCR